MKKMKKISWGKIILTVVVIGIVVFVICEFNVSLDPPRQIEEVVKTQLPTQIVVGVLMPAHAIAEQNDFHLQRSNPEAYANRFNSNNELYNRSIEFAYEAGMEIGDTIQLKYSSYFNYRDVSIWKLLYTKPPVYESIEQTESSYVEYLKCVVLSTH